MNSYGVRQAGDYITTTGQTKGLSRRCERYLKFLKRSQDSHKDLTVCSSVLLRALNTYILIHCKIYNTNKMNSVYLFALGVAVLVCAVQGDWNPCTGRLEGALAEIGCWGYKRCIKGVPRTFACPNNTVLERDSLKCVRIGTGNTACGKPTSCAGLADGNYPDLGVGCISFYSCANGLFMGRHYCDANLVFDRPLDACNWIENVPAPCGTKP
ncbi:hypothetical protein Btru_076038 [Bulinus truncatus]|nr:hypothetical protein Btru_076038 [Bulinus truncatus]